MFDEQPIGALLALSWAHSREDPASVKLFALQSEIQLPFRISLLGGLAIPKAAIPDHDRSATVLAFRDRAFEVAVIQGWSSTSTANRLLWGSKDGPLVTAQDLKTQSNSSLRS
jgi:hypothetical protein